MQTLSLIYFACNLSKNIIINKHPERSGDGIFNVWRVGNDAWERIEVEFIAEDDDCMSTIENGYKEQSRADNEFETVADAVIDKEIFHYIALD